MKVHAFAEIEAEFVARVSRVVWANLASIDEQGRPRSRVVHPVWEGTTGWVTSRLNTAKVKHFEIHPYASVSYAKEIATPVYVECHAEWVNNTDVKIHASDFMRSLPEPYGFDPLSIFKTMDDPNYGLLKLTPWRIQLVNLPAGPMQIWEPSS